MSKDKSWWTILRSMKLGLYLVLAIVSASIVGTIIPQQQMNSSEGGLKTLFQLSDLFHSWWYITLLALLSLNLVACSLYRLKTIRLGLGRSYRLLDKEQLTKLKAYKMFALTGNLDEEKNKVLKILSSQRYEVCSVLLEGKCRIGAQHSRYGVLGSYITHISFLLIIAGLLIGAIFGCQGSINVPVGTTFSLSSVPGINLKALKNDFQVRVDDFWIERYPNAAPSGYFSRLTVFENSQEIQTTTLGVNSPLNYEGTKFYQARYGDAIEIQVDGPGARTMYQGFVTDLESFKIPETNLTVLARIDHNRAASVKSEPVNNTNPKIIYTLFQDGRRIDMGVAEMGSVINLGQEGTSLRLIRSVPYTGLQVKKDPGIPLIWMGSMFMILGMGISFFLQPRHLWMEMEQQEGNKLCVSIGGKAARNPLMLEDHIKSIINDIQAGATPIQQKSNQEERQENEQL